MAMRYNLNRLAYFVATMDEGTITAAAARLGISKAVVSKQLQLLEGEVGVPLLLRNTRTMQPTEAGRALYEGAAPAVRQATDAFEAVMERGTVPKGRLRITAPVDYGLSHVAPLVARYRERYPAVEIDLVLADEVVDKVGARVDLSFRVGWLKDSSDLARKLQDFEEIAVATPETLARFPVERPEDLGAVPFMASHAIADRPSWTFARGGETRKVALRPVSTMNITLAVRSAVLCGGSFMILPDFLARDDLAGGALVRLLTGWSLRRGGIYTVTAPGTVRANALRAFIAMAHGEG